MSKYLLALPLLAAVGVVSLPAASAQETSGENSIGYFLGYSVGQQMTQSGFEDGDFNLDSLMEGFRDAFGGKEAKLNDEQLRATQSMIQSLLIQRQQQRMDEKKAEGTAYLAENAKKEGVKTLKGGVQYKVLKAGDGNSPGPTDTVKVHYTGKLIDGTTFDSSVERGQPATFQVNQVIQGWQMALQEMKVGSKWMLYIPSDLAYGERGSQGAIGPNEVLVFEVELLAIQ